VAPKRRLSGSETKEPQPDTTDYTVLYETHEYELSSSTNYSFYTTPPQDGMVKFSLDKNPVLEDLPLDCLESFSENIHFERFFQNTHNLLVDFQAEVKEEFNGLEVKLKDLELVLGRLILRTKNSENGSTLISRFVQASRNNNSEAISRVFDSFVNQAESVQILNLYMDLMMLEDRC
jgi:hypothetical protein